MNEKLRITDKGRFLCFEYTDAFSVPKAKECIDVMVQACSARGCHSAMLDCRPMSGEMTTLDRFEVASYAQILRDAGIRVAMIARKDQINGPVSFTETVARNRGIDMFIFEDYQTASEWLQN
jgi:hypothetical protein